MKLTKFEKYLIWLIPAITGTVLSTIYLIIGDTHLVELVFLGLAVSLYIALLKGVLFWAEISCMFVLKYRIIKIQGIFNNIKYQPEKLSLGDFKYKPVEMEIKEYDSTNFFDIACKKYYEKPAQYDTEKKALEIIQEDKRFLKQWKKDFFKKRDKKEEKNIIWKE